MTPAVSWCRTCARQIAYGAQYCGGASCAEGKRLEPTGAAPCGGLAYLGAKEFRCAKPAGHAPPCSPDAAPPRRRNTR